MRAGATPALLAGLILALPARASAQPSPGTYRYDYPYDTETLIEDHAIVLEPSGDGLIGWYYGTSDDFDSVREGYPPGFFVAPMRALTFSGDDIRFVLEVPAEAYLADPVPLSHRDAEALAARGAERWGQAFAAPPRTYEGRVEGARIVLIVDGAERVFHRDPPEGGR